MSGDLLDKALGHHQKGNLGQARKLYKKILKSDPKDADALHLLGLIAHQTGKHERARDLIEKAVRLAPGHAMAFNNLGEVHRALGAFEKAVESYRKAIGIDPAYAEAHGNLGLALNELGKTGEAEECYRKAIDIDASLPEPRANLGNLLRERGDPEAAAESFREALAIAPNMPGLLCDLGNALVDLGKRDEAVDCFRRAIAIHPDFANAHNNLGNVLMDLNQKSEAAECYRRCLEIQPDRAEVLIHLGNAHSDLNRLEEAIACFGKVLEIDPDNREATALLYRQYQRTCLWEAMAELEPVLDRQTREALGKGGKPGESPFINISRSMDPKFNFDVARAWSRDISRRAARLAEPFRPWKKAEKDGVISIGYLSCDFHNHATAHLMSGLFALHDRDRFRVSAYSYGPDDESAYRRKIIEDCDGFKDIRSLSTKDAARLIHDDKIDILVDLKGYTRGGRMDICALRPAPVQAAYLGFPGTTGADFFDYVITDKTVTPPEHLDFYSERPAYLPHCYQVNDRNQPIAETGITRASEGLPENGFVFCSFNQPFKFEPAMFAAWMGLMTRVPGSVLWLFAGNAPAKENLKREAETQGVSGDRLVFAENRPKDEHLERLRFADLMLDTRIYTGHTTNSDALWAGVPVVTLAGAHFASRVSASLLRAIGLPELIVQNLEDYLSLAFKLATDGKTLNEIKSKLAGNRLSTPLFDTPLFTHGLEKLYRRMWELYRRGEKAALIDLE